ncbi:MAG: M23 family metallopeptidase [Bacteroidota bacterium]|nr:M23 family metallopeptidase [Bacteroidota bacterium]
MMDKNKYRFDNETLRYVKIKLTTRQKIGKVLPGILTTILLALLFTYLYPKVYESPTVQKLKMEINQLSLQYKMLNQEFSKAEAVLVDIQERDDNIYRTIFAAEPIPGSVRSAGYGGSDRYDNLRGFDYSDLVINTSKRLDKITKRIVVQSKSYDDVVKLALNKEKLLSCVPAIQPISNRDLKRVASGWGWRIHPIYKIRKFHYGIDFTSPTGTEIYTTGDGVVKSIRSSRIGYGKRIIIDHGFGYETLYAHMSKFNVKKGDVVKRGDVIGYVGDTGTSTAPHLHYEVWKDGKKVNPKNFFFKDLTPEQYDKMIELSSNSGKTFD